MPEKHNGQFALNRQKMSVYTGTCCGSPKAGSMWVYVMGANPLSPDEGYTGNK